MNTSNNPTVVPPNTIIDRRHTYDNDEISLFDILDVLLKNKKIIVITTLFFAIAAGFYAFSIKPTYQSEIYLALPDTRAVIEMNVFNIATENSSKNYTQENVYGKFIANFNSKKLKAKFLNEHNLASLYCKELTEECVKDARISFDESFTLDAKKFEGIFKLDSNPTATSETLNNYVNFINQQTIKEIATEIKVNHENKISLFENKNKELIESYENNIHDELINLTDAITIAKKLGYKEVQTNIPMSLEREVPFHFYGYEYLEARKNVLLKRKDDIKAKKLIKAYVPEVRKNESTIANLKAISYDASLFQTVTLDRKALTPKSPIAPKKKLIVILGAILGMMLSLFIVFIKQIIQARKNSLVNGTSTSNA